MRVIAVCEQGSVRGNNEDSIYYNSEKGFFAVADGMGGHEAGEVASSLAIEKVGIELEENSAISASDIERAFTETNKVICEKSCYKEQKMNMGTTLSIFIIQDNRGYIGHIGDSRVYLIRNQEIIKLTEDHTYVERLYQEGIITYDEYTNHPKKNILLKALGSEKSIDPQVLEFQIIHGDIVFMCSDGVHNLIKNDELLNILLQKKGKNAVKAINSLIEERGSNDNYSYIIIDQL